jgi:DNA-binding beta-propeller fold protein YncE
MHRALAILLLIGCALLIAGVAGTALASRQPEVSSVSAGPSVDIRARFSNLAPDGQSTGFAVGPDGSLGVVDRTRQRVIRLDPTGQVLTEWGPRFEDDAPSTDLSGLAAGGADGTWYLLDRGRQRILRLDLTGHAVGAIDLARLGTYGPNGLTLDEAGDVYVADTGQNRILVFGPDGALKRTIGTAGSGLGQLKQPMSMAFGADGSLVVTDLENNRIERWDSRLESPSAWPLDPHAWGVAVDHLGRVFAPDAEHRAVRMFDGSGQLLATVATPLDFPTQVGLTPDGSGLWVLGANALGYLDLSPYAQLVRPAGPDWPSRSMAIAGLVLALFSLAALAGAALLPRAAWRGKGTAGSIPIADESVARLARAQAIRWPKLAHAYLRSRAIVAAGIVLLLVGAAGVAVGQLAISDATTRGSPWPLLGLMVGGGLLWAVGASMTARVVPVRWFAAWAGTSSTRDRTTRDRTYPAWRVCVLATAALAGLVAALMWWVGHFETVDSTHAAFVWLGAVVLAAIACSGSRQWPIRWHRPGVIVLAGVGLFALALMPRIWQVADLPFGIWYDEAQGALEIRRVVAQGTYAPILNTYGRDTSGFFYLIPLVSLALGDGIFAARATSAIVGALTVSLTYLLGRELFGWRVGLVAGGLLALMRWHLNFSRLAFNPISLPLCTVLAFWLLARAVRRGRWPDFVLAGLALGVGLHAYTGFRAIVLVAMVGLAYAAVTEHWSMRVIAGRAGLYLAAALLTALPVAIFAVRDPVAFNARTVQTLILASPVDNGEKLRLIWENLQRHLLMFNVSGDLNGRHNLPGLPMLDPLTSALVAIGLGWLLIRPLDWRTVLLMAWAGAALAQGILTFAFEAPQAVRTIAITPLLALLGGLGLVALLDRLVAFLTVSRMLDVRRVPLLASALGVVAVGSIGFMNLDTFFNRQMPDPATWASFSTRETIVAKAARDGRGQYEAVLTSATLAPSMQEAYLVPDLQATIHVFDPARDLPYRGNGPALVYLETEHDQPLADAVARMYPEAATLPGSAPAGGAPVVSGFRLDRALLDQHRGGWANYRGADGTEVARAEAEPPWLAESTPVPLPADLDWRAALALDTTGTYGFRVPPGFVLRVDDAALQAAASDGIRVALARGTHLLEVSGTIESDAQPMVEWWPPGEVEWSPVATTSLYLAPAGGNGLRLNLTPLSEPASAADEYIDPVLAHYFHITPFASVNGNPPEWVAEWDGVLDAPSTGSYDFALDHSEHAALSIDGSLLMTDLGMATAKLESQVELTAGRHAISVRFEKTEDGAPWIDLYWTPPGGQHVVVPGSVLYPPPPAPVGQGAQEAGPDH